MANGVNKVIGIGNLTKTPEGGQGKSGKSYCNFTVAASTGYGDYKHTEYMNCVAFGKTAEAIMNYTDKGDSVYVEGEMNTEKWEKDGVTRYTTKVKVFTVQFLKTKGKDGGQQKQQETGGGFDPNDQVPF